MYSHIRAAVALVASCMSMAVGPFENRAVAATIQLATDQTLQEAIHFSNPGDTIEIGRSLTEAVTVDKPIRLVGRGDTTIEFRTAPVLSVRRTSGVVVEGLTFKTSAPQSPNSAALISLEDAGATLSNCKLLGGPSGLLSEGRTELVMGTSRVEGAAGAGVRLSGHSVSSISNSTITGNRGGGVFAAGHAAATLEANKVHENGEGAQIVFDGHSTGTASRNKVAGRVGIVVKGQAAPALTGNSVQASRTGLSFDEWAAGEVADNLVSKAQTGIRIAGNAQPHLVGNTVENCTEHGLYAGASSGGKAERNTFRGHGISGVLLTGRSTTDLSQNVVEDNVTGIACYSATASVVADNLVSRNLGDGIVVFSPGDFPTLRRNVVVNNRNRGISRLDGFPRLESNIVARNRIGIEWGIGTSGPPSFLGNYVAYNTQVAVLGTSVGANILAGPSATAELATWKLTNPILSEVEVP